jgi:hypothetical protein
MRSALAAVFVLLLTLAVACGGGSDASVAKPTAASSLPPATTRTSVPELPSATPSPGATEMPAPSPTPVNIRRDIRATRLVIPALGLDAEVQAAPTVPYVYVPNPGCPPGPQDSETVSVPDQGIATPADSLEGLENKAWIFGHSRWLGVPGLFLGLQDLDIGDELFIDGIDRATEQPVTGERFVVDGMYLSDIDSGDAFLTAEDPSEIPPAPIVVLQTSVRERGAGRPWILDEPLLLSKAQNIVEGDLDDPCKYLLLFVTATPG